MAKPLKREDLKWEQSQAEISLAGIRPLTFGSESVGASAEATYTVANIVAKRIVVAHSGSGNEDIRFDLNATAVTGGFPIFPNMYFVVEVEKGDVVHVFNNNASAVKVYFLEIR